MRNTEKKTKRMKNDEYLKILAGYTGSNFQDVESYLRTQVDQVEDDVRLVLVEYFSSFITDEVQPGIYTFEDLSEVFFDVFQHDYLGFSNVIDIELDDISTKII